MVWLSFVTTSTRDPRFSVHRTRAGLGLFTNVPFKRGDFVIEYTGELITSEEADRRGGKYLFEINSKWNLDGKERGNIARYINHSCRPNCETDVIGKRVKIYAKRAIRPGEELTYNYGKEYFEDFIKSQGCKCDACAASAKKGDSRGK